MCTGLASAAPKADARDKAKLAAQAQDLRDRGEHESALAVVEQGLTIAPKDVTLLGLKGKLLLDLRDYSGALAAYQAYLEAGATGGGRREALKVVDALSAVRTTFLDITLTSGSAEIYLESRSQGRFCTAAPTCNKPILPGPYKVIAERPGFERWTGPISVPSDKITRLAITLVEKPSLITIRVPLHGAQVTLDGAIYDAPRTVPAGKHQVSVSLKGYVPVRLEAVAREGVPVELDISLAPVVPVRSAPPTAQLLLDGKPIVVEDGAIAVPPGAHTLVGRAAGFRDRSVDIPAERPADFAVVVELERIEVHRELWRRKAAVIPAGVGVVSAIGGLMFRSGAQNAVDDKTACRARGCDALSSQTFDERADSLRFNEGLAFAACGFSAVAVTVLWLTDSDARMAVTPRVGAGTGVDVAVRF